MKTIMSTTAVFVILAAPAFAQGMSEVRGRANNAVQEANDGSARVVGLTGALKGQINLGDVTSELTVVTEETDDAADVGGLATRALQLNGGDITATLNGKLSDVDGEVSATAAATGNSTSLSVASATGVIGSTVAQANRGDVEAIADAAVREADKAVSVTAAAIGNSASIVNGIAD
jgi:hypothetical protein